ncbi:MAG: 6-carboxytetrahydropterin synthase [Nitrospirae bacterium]|nr:6-carboxytetrahydropterin synthase [Nitrospirota bacterium]
MKGEVYLTRRIEFSAAHYYRNPAWDEARNRATFDRCVDLHGHNYLLEATIAGKVDDRTGMVVNMADLKAALREVHDLVDHKNLNRDTPFFAERIPTTEELVRALRAELARRLPTGDRQAGVRGARLHRVCLSEGEAVSAEARDEEEGMPAANGNVYLTRACAFSAPHRLHAPDLTEEENRRVFGKCNNLHGHGHDYRLEVILAGPVQEATGMVCDLAELDRLLRETVVERYDHRHLNDLEEFRGRNTTAEVIVRTIWDRLCRVLPPGLLHGLRLRETRDNLFEYYG